MKLRVKIPETELLKCCEGKSYEILNTNFRDQIRLEKKNFQLSTPILNVFNFLDIFLMKRNFFKAVNEKLVVLRFLSNKFLRYCK